MKYLLPFLLLLSSCSSVKEMTYPIDAEQQRQLVERESPVVGVNLYHVSILAAIITLLVVSFWFLAWRRTQKSVEGDSSST